MQKENQQNYDLFGKEVDATTTCSGKYVLNPFSIIDTRDGNFKKNEQKWLLKGIKSELGREVECNADIKGFKTTTSVFSPTICEVMYRWFCPEGGKILDPFAGGSVRGIVANYLGYDYTGIELRMEQVESNYEQSNDIFKPLPVDTLPAFHTDKPSALTPVQLHDDIYFKRDDYLKINGANGGKVRTAYNLIKKALEQGIQGFTTAGSRNSLQCKITAQIAQYFSVPLRCHTPSGQLGQELQDAQAVGATVVQHTAGYNSVIIARAREDAAERGWLYIPFGMGHEEAITQNRAQIDGEQLYNVNRIVVPCGSGMTLAGILTGLKDKFLDVPVIAVRVGADPTDILDKFAPKNWREMVTIVEAESDYNTPAKVTTLRGVELDPYYEAKCIPFVEPADLMWIVANRNDREPIRTVYECKLPNWIIGDSNQILDMIYDAEFDFVFSCPPYGDLEVYSDLPEDISNMKYPEFLAVYRQIIAKSISLLKRGCFAAFVVSEFRDKNGYYYGFVPDTVQAFKDAGCALYNEIVLVNNFGSAGVRANNCMKTSKVVRVHQNILVFKKL